MSSANNREDSGSGSDDEQTSDRREEFGLNNARTEEGDSFKYKAGINNTIIQTMQPEQDSDILDDLTKKEKEHTD